MNLAFAFYFAVVGMPVFVSMSGESENNGEHHLKRKENKEISHLRLENKRIQNFDLQSHNYEILTLNYGTVRKNVDKNLNLLNLLITIILNCGK